MAKAEKVNYQQYIDFQSMWLSNNDTACQNKMWVVVEKMVDMYKQSSTSLLVKGVVISVLKNFSQKFPKIMPNVMVNQEAFEIALDVMEDPEQSSEAKTDAAVLMMNITEEGTKDKVLTERTINVFLTGIQYQGDSDEVYSQLRYMYAQCLTAMVCETKSADILHQHGVIDKALHLLAEKRPSGIPTIIHCSGLLLLAACIPDDPAKTRQVFLRVFPHIKRVLANDDIAQQFLTLAMLSKFVLLDANRQDMIDAGVFESMMRITEAGSRNQNSMTFYESIGMAQQGQLAGHTAAISFCLLQDGDLRSEQRLMDQLLLICQHGDQSAKQTALTLIGLLLLQIEDNPDLHYRILQYGVVPTIVEIVRSRYEGDETLQIAEQVWQVVATDDRACAAIAKGGMLPMMSSNLDIPGLELRDTPTLTYVKFEQ
eukprot:TRINITY_DN4483_c1_g2_i1.p2 TRINITY_DN4483_c1_g2~~TRINITY_DN4483_c1_g2_i1.p2  ORF type:complete len:495 (-),score=80.92 TRINITY_DN4483_c1_g2_i1:622-1902(-)